MCNRFDRRFEFLTDYRKEKAIKEAERYGLLNDFDGEVRIDNPELSRYFNDNKIFFQVFTANWGKYGEDSIEDVRKMNEDETCFSFKLKKNLSKEYFDTKVFDADPFASSRM